MATVLKVKERCLDSATPKIENDRSILGKIRLGLPQQGYIQMGETPLENVKVYAQLGSDPFLSVGSASLMMYDWDYLDLFVHYWVQITDSMTGQQILLPTIERGKQLASEAFPEDRTHWQNFYSELQYGVYLHEQAVRKSNDIKMWEEIFLSRIRNEIPTATSLQVMSHLSGFSEPYASASFLLQEGCVPNTNDRALFTAYDVHYQVNGVPESYFSQ